MKLDWVTFALEVVNFLVLVWILHRFLYRPVLAAIGRRREAIEQALADAGARRREAQSLEQRYAQRMQDWEREKDGLRARALEEVAAERARRMAELEHALGEARERARAGEAQRLAALHDRLGHEAAARAATFAARLLERLAGPELEGRIVAAALEDLAALDAGRRAQLAGALRDAGGQVEVASAHALAPAAREALGRALEAAAGAAPRLAFREDPALVAGLSVAVGPILLQANVRNELQFFAPAGAHAG